MFGELFQGRGGAPRAEALKSKLLRKTGKGLGEARQAAEARRKVGEP